MNYIYPILQNSVFALIICNDLSYKKSHVSVLYITKIPKYNKIN